MCHYFVQLCPNCDKVAKQPSKPRLKCLQRPNTRESGCFLVFFSDDLIAKLNIMTMSNTTNQHWLDAIKFNADGLVPTIAQDHQTGQILMMAWQNREALLLTKQTGTAVYFSRSRGKLWYKGESSGHTQLVHDIFTDCDGDTVILSITQLGGIACHTGRQSCFYQRLDDDGQWQINQAVIKDPAQIYTTDNQVAKPNHHAMVSVLTTLHQTLQERKTADKDTSYVASLYHRGINKILEKVGEEAVESIIAAKELQLTKATNGKDLAQKQHDFVYEVADTWFHQMVALSALDLSVFDVIDELARRVGISGIDEKNSRTQ